MADSIRSWLERHDLEKYAATFAEHEITLAALPLLSDADLKEMGISLGARRIILASIAEVQPEKESIPTRVDSVDAPFLPFVAVRFYRRC